MDLLREPAKDVVPYSYEKLSLCFVEIWIYAISYIIRVKISRYFPVSENEHEHMSNRQNYCSTNLVLLRLSLAEGYAKPSLLIGVDTRTIPLFCMSRLKVCERRNLHYRQGTTLICVWHENEQVILSAVHMWSAHESPLADDCGGYALLYLLL